MLSASRCWAATPDVVAVAASFAAGWSASALSAVASSRLERRMGSAMGSRLHEDYCVKTRAEDNGTYGSTPPGYASNKAAIISSVFPFARMPSRWTRWWSVTTTLKRSGTRD